jgi:hypothetical protein
MISIPRDTLADVITTRIDDKYYFDTTQRLPIALSFSYGEGER